MHFKKKKTKKHQSFIHDGSRLEFKMDPVRLNNSPSAASFSASVLHAAKVSDGRSSSLILTPRWQESDANDGASANYPAKRGKRPGASWRQRGGVWTAARSDVCVPLQFINTQLKKYLWKVRMETKEAIWENCLLYW